MNSSHRDSAPPLDDTSPSGDSTAINTRPEQSTGSRRWLLVIGDGVFATHVIPNAGAVVIGRTPQCDVQIDHPSISRKHACLNLGPPMTIQDLDSANGTRVGETRIPAEQRVPIRTGEVVELGSVMIIIQDRTVPVRQRRLWTHGYFEARLEEECVRAERSGASFTVLRVRCGPTIAAPGIEQALFDSLRSVDVLGTYGPQEYETILIDSHLVDAQHAIRRVRESLGAAAEDVHFGAAVYPNDGRDADSLMAAASHALRGVAAHEADDVPVIRGESMPRLQRLVERIAAGNISVLILGETGVGKEVLAERIHRLSPREGKPFLRLNCAALAESLLESELFGHEKGAFTGAIREKPGLLESASGGTVFLDEIGELPMTIQVKLLRVLEERRAPRVGGLRPREIDVRFVAATNRDLEAEIARGMFRQDLYFRLAGITLSVPPLRERTDEIPGLVQAFVADACRDMKRAQRPQLSPETLALIRQYSWPGNIRELRNVIERSVLLCTGDVVLPVHLPIEKMTATQTPRSYPGRAPRQTFPPEPAVVAAPTPPEPAPAPADLTRTPGESPLARAKREIWELERQRVIDALNECAGNQTRAARALGFSRRTLLKRLDDYALPRPRKAAGSGDDD